MPAVPTLPTNWTPNHAPTATELKQVLDAINFELGPPVFFGFQTVAQSLTSGTWADLLLDETFDDFGFHGAANTSSVTPTYPGKYLAVGTCATSSNGSGSRGCRITLNGGTQTGRVTLGAAVVTDVACYPGFGIVSVNGSTDVVRAQGFQSSGGALNTSVSLPDIRSSLTLWFLSK